MPARRPRGRYLRRLNLLKPTDRSGQDAPPTIVRRTAYRRTRYAIAGAAGSALVVAALAGSASAEDQQTQTEAHRFGAVAGQALGSASHLRGDYAIYTSRAGAAVDIAHWTGPDATDWEVTTLEAPAAETGFGTSVRLDEDANRAFISASTGAAVYLYTRSGDNTWTLAETLAPGGFPARVTSYSTQGQSSTFGESLDVQGDRLVVGVPNATVDNRLAAGFVFVVDLSTRTWTPLIPTTVHGYSITGQSLALDGDHLAVGAPQYNGTRNVRAGGLYMWDLGSPGTDPLFITQPETPRVCLFPEGSSGPDFGMSLAFSGGVLYVGSSTEIDYTGDDPGSKVDGCEESAVDAGNTTQGAVYRFDSDLKQIGPKLVAPASGYGFGNSIAVDGDVLLANSDHGPDYRGEVRVYDTNDLTTGAGDENGRERIQPVRTLVASDAAGGFGRQFNGTGISVSGDRALVVGRSAQSKADTAYLFEPIAPEVEVSVAAVDVAVEYGQQARLTATVSDPEAEGTVTFSIDGVEQPAVAVTGGEAGLSLGAAGHDAGTHPVLATYTASRGEVSVSDDATLIVRKAATSTSMSGQPARVTVGDTMTVTGKVAGRYGTIPEGSVVIVVDGANVGRTTLDTTGAYRWAVRAEDVGALSLRAEYVGDANHLASRAGDQTVEVVTASPKSLPSEATPTAGESSGPRAAIDAASGRLPTTGSQVLPAIVAALVLLAAGAGALVVRRRRTR